ncbi:MAG: caspase family protein [Oculatellaceae cyanobacterium Prado106]|nr:caspase family protein [Oculatellaceae cyanobacterium Prado106]
MSNVYALLIGIDCYLPNRLPDGSSYRNLGGSVRDINHVEAYLKEWLKVPASQILKLTATCSPTDLTQPIEPPDQLPTRQNMVDRLRQLGQMAPAGSQVYIHFSGHGGRAATVFESIKGVGEIDEGLVPTDLGTSEGQYLRDLELAHLLQELVQRQLTVTLVLDCCHSGGATRGDAEIRGSNVIDHKPFLPNNQSVASLEELGATWRSLTPTTRSLKASGLPETEGCVVLAACRPHEYAYEYAFNRETKERNGALTYWLLDTLKQNPGQTYKDLYDRINAQIHSQFPAQTPLLLGEGDRQIFGQSRSSVVFAVPVLKVETESTGTTMVRLGVGQANGVTKGAEFAIYPRGTTDLTLKENRVAIAKIIDRGDTNSLCSVAAIPGQPLVQAGDQAVQVALAPRLVRKVAFFVQDIVDATQLTPQVNRLTPEIFAQQQAAFDAIRAAIPGNGWIELDESVTAGDSGELINFIIAINNNGEYEICPGGSVEPFRNINPPLKITDPATPQKLVNRLVHLAKYQAALAIDNVDLDSPLSGKLTVEWLGTSDVYDRGDPIPPKSQLQSFIDPTQPQVKLDEHIFLSIRNDSTSTLNIAVLNFAANWSVTQIYPAKPTEQFSTLEPGKDVKIPIQPTPDEIGEAIENTVKVFATKGQANFRWLELPSLDQPLVSRVTRSSSPLDMLLSAIGSERPPTRSLQVAASPSREWTTQQVSLFINASSASPAPKSAAPAPPEPASTPQRHPTSPIPEPPPTNSFNISGSSITNLSGSGNIYAQSSPSQSNPRNRGGSPSTKTILMLAANPKDTPSLRLGEEARSLQTSLERSQYRDCFTLQQRWAVTVTDLRRAMLDFNPQIVHFSGHGEGEEGLLFEDELGKSKFVSTESLAALLGLFAQSSNPLECVVLNGCYSVVQAKAIAHHIPYVIGMKQAILDRAAIAFSGGFYDALGAGRSVPEAFRFGKVAIQLEGIPEHELPILLPEQASS